MIPSPSIPLPEGEGRSFSLLPPGEGPGMRPAGSPLRRGHRRTFRKLRVSLTRSCNFGCVYCAHDGKAVFDAHETPVAQFIGWIQKILSHTPINKIRLTGGEPALYSGLVELTGHLYQLTNAEISMTTNGHNLASLAAPLRAAGLTSVNVSLDAVDQDVFKSMGGRAYQNVIAGIRQARDSGLQVKINATLVREMNDNQILPLLQFARSEGLTLRFLELMDMGHLHDTKSRRLIPAQFILDTIGNEFVVEPVGRAISETAEYFQLPDGYRFGIVGNSSMPFCNDCDRLRLDSQGRIFGCLSKAQGIPLEGGDTKEILEQAMALKQPAHFTGSQLVMREIGG